MIVVVRSSNSNSSNNNSNSNSRKMELHTGLATGVQFVVWGLEEKGEK